MPKNNDSDNSKSRNYGSRNDNKKSVQSNKNNQYELIDINVKKAQQDIKKIFDSAKTELDKFHKAQEDAMKKSTASMQKQYEDAFSNISKKYEQSLGNMSPKNAADALGGNSNARSSKSNNAPNQKDKLAEQLSELKKSNESNNKLGVFDNKYSSNLAGKIGEQINKNYSKGLENLASKIDSRSIRSNKTLTDEFSKLTDAQIKGMDNLNKIAPFIKAGEVLFDGVKVVLDNWVDRFFDGMNKIVSTYESTYKQVSVLTNMNQEQYTNWQNNTVKILKQQGLDNNVTISQMMEELSTVTSKGIIDVQKATEVSLQNSITKSITPYLDTTTDAYQDLQLKFGSKFVTQMNGIVKSVGDSAGSVRYISQNMNDIITKLEPIAQNATNEQFAQQFAEAASMIDSAVSSGDMTLAQANELKNMTMEAMDPIKALKSDNLAVREFAATASDEDFQDISKVTEEVGKNLAKWGDVADSQNARARGALGEAIGVDTMSFTWNPLQSGEWAKAIKSGNNTGDVEAAGKELQENFKNDQYTTSKQQKENYAENMSTGVAAFKEKYPDAYDFLKAITTSVVAIAGINLISGVGKLLGVGAEGGGLLGKLSGSGGLFSKFLGKGSALTSSVEAGTTASTAASSTLAGFTTVAGGIALGVGAAKVIQSAVEGAREKSEKNYQSAAAQKLKGTDLEDNDAAAQLTGTAEEISKGNNNFFTNWGSGINQFFEGIGAKWDMAFSGDLRKINEHEYKLFRESIRNQGVSDDIANSYLLAYAMMLDSVGMSDIMGDGYSSSNIKNMYNSEKLDIYGQKDMLEAATKNIINMNKAPYRSKDERVSGIDWSKYDTDGSHATGLEYVPEDGYIAKLHQGESVLTKGAADIVRSLGNISGETGMASAISNLFNIVATPIKEILGNNISNNNTSGNSSSKEVVDAIYYQTSVLESAINNIGKNNSSNNGDNTKNNKTNVLTMRTNYNNNLINLVPSMR